MSTVLVLIACLGAAQLSAQSKPAHLIASNSAPAPLSDVVATTAPPTPELAPTFDHLEDPAVTVAASTIFTQMRSGKIDDALLTPTMSDGLSPAALAHNKPMFDKLGAPLRFTVEYREKILTGTKYDYLATFASEQLHVRVFVTPSGKIAGYYLAR